MLLDSEIKILRRDFDAALFEEARRISSWKELLRKVAGGEKVMTDASLPPIEEPKSGFIDGGIRGQFDDIFAILALFSQHLSRDTRQFFPSNSLFVTTIQTRITPTSDHPSLSPHLPSHSFSYQPDFSEQLLTLVQPDDISLTERFHSSLFDETDNEKLARSLVRCKSVCGLIGAEKCILDIAIFIHRTVSVLGTSNSLIRAAAFSLLRYLDGTSFLIPLLPRLWNRLRSAFRDGHPEEQLALIRLSARWIMDQMGESCLPPFPAAEFDWDGLISADLSDINAFIFSVLLIMFLQLRPIKEQIGREKTLSIILSFERHQQAVSRIVSIFDEIQLQQDDPEDDLDLISYCLLISLRFNFDFPSNLTKFLTQQPEIDIHTLLPHENKVILICHSSLNPHKPHQPPLDFLFERTLRMNPLDFFLHHSEPDADISTSLLNTSLCGFHALCRRGVHFDLMGSDAVRCGEHPINSFWLFFTPHISDTFDLFLYFPPPLVVRFFLPILSSSSNPSFLVEPLRAMMITLLVTTAPFGDCHSLKELYRSVRQLNRTS
ncbi:hypothetical protein BLNAU_24769 [Blattamonas nauphoetae]|uniref:Uncharacterized protein n=1 Tax=Blattamonas nauphoetae TaxID=2049346 RepID=A0ABQ9WLI7_9EUKA|nr:hypothetical protein BLNAU_24769 [Blattamonas nauphoetae]